MNTFIYFVRHAISPFSLDNERNRGLSNQGMQDNGQKIAIGTHGNIMTIILNYFDKNYGYDFWLQTSKPDIYKLEFDGIELLRVNRLWEP